MGEEEEVSIKEVALNVAEATGLKDSQIKVSMGEETTDNVCISSPI